MIKHWKDWICFLCLGEHLSKTKVYPVKIQCGDTGVVWTQPTGEFQSDIRHIRKIVNSLWMRKGTPTGSLNLSSGSDVVNVGNVPKFFTQSPGVYATVDKTTGHT